MRLGVQMGAARGGVGGAYVEDVFVASTADDDNALSHTERTASTNRKEG